MKIKLHIHLGMPRTGTTLLRNNFFSNLDCINYIGKMSYPNKELDKFSRSIITMSDRNFAKNLTNIKNILENYKFSKEKINVISFEGFLFSHQYLSNDTHRTFKRLISLFHELKNYFDLKFLLVLRDQSSILFSYYCHFYSLFAAINPKLNNQEYFFNFQNTKKDNDLHKIYSSFKYDLYIKILDKYFSNQYIVLDYNQLNKNPDIYLNNLYKFVEIKNKKAGIENYYKKKINDLAVKDNLIYIKFFFNVFFKSKIKLFLINLNIKKLITFPKSFFKLISFKLVIKKNEKFERKFKEIYLYSNISTRQKTGIDLS